MDELIEIACPECGHDGPYPLIDESAAECGNCYASIDLTGGEE
jgi:hypothetical protein